MPVHAAMNTADDSMKAKGFIVTPETYGPTLDVVGTKITVLASVEQTRGCEFTLQRGAEGSGPPLHSHGWDEYFFVLKGTIEFTCDGRTTLCKPGALVFIPANTMHSFRYGAGGAEMLELAGPGGQAVQMFTAVSKVPFEPATVPRLIEVLGQNGVTVAA